MFSSIYGRNSLSQSLRVQFELKVGAWIFYTDAIDNVQVFTHSCDHTPWAEYLTHFCQDAPLYSKNTYCLIPPYVAQLITYLQETTSFGMLTPSHHLAYHT